MLCVKTLIPRAVGTEGNGSIMLSFVFVVFIIYAAAGISAVGLYLWYSINTCVLFNRSKSRAMICIALLLPRFFISSAAVSLKQPTNAIKAINR